MTRLKDLDSLVKFKRKALDLRIAEAHILAQRGKKLEEDIERLNFDINTYDKAVLLLNSIGEERQAHAQNQIESLVTRGLQTIFGNAYSFHVTQVIKSKRPEVVFSIRSPVAGGHTVETPVLTSRGGGTAAVVGVLLRIVLLLLDKKDKETPLILDESFSHLSDDHLAAMGQFLRELVDLTGIQIIMVTHQRDFGVYADKIHDFTLHSGLTKAKEISVSDI